MAADDRFSVGLNGNGQDLLVGPRERVEGREGSGGIFDIPTSIGGAAGLLIGEIAVNIGQIGVKLDDDAAGGDVADDVPGVMAVGQGEENLDVAVKFDRTIIVDKYGDAGALAECREGF